MDSSFLFPQFLGDLSLRFVHQSSGYMRCGDGAIFVTTRCMVGIQGFSFFFVKKKKEEEEMSAFLTPPLAVLLPSVSSMNTPPHNLGRGAPPFVPTPPLRTSVPTVM